MKIHPHMLRHSCGFKLANDGRRYPDHPEPFGPQIDPAHRPIH
jgi:integrase